MLCRHPKGVRHTKKSALLAIVIEHGRNPFPRLERTGKLICGIREGASVRPRHHGRLRHLKCSRSRHLPAVDQRKKAILHRHDTELAQGIVYRLGVERGKRLVLKIVRNGGIGTNRSHLAREQGVIDMRSEVLTHLALNLVGVGDHLVETAILRDECARLLGTDARHAGDVIGAIALESIEIGHEGGSDSVIEVVYALRRHDGHVREAFARRHHVDVLGNQLVHVAVARDQVHIASSFLARAGKGS